ncbi:MAG: hypothetical protein ACE5GA_09160 [Candidatus Zixiibacteriota bacterium]
MSCISKRLMLLAFVVTIAGSAAAQGVKMKVGGEGVIGKDSVRAGESFSFDLYMSNDGFYSGFTLGFKLYGEGGIKTVKHAWTSSPKDSAFDPSSNIHPFNGFEDKSVWDMGGFMRRVQDWDGKLPDYALIGGVAMNKGWNKCDFTHFVSFEMSANGKGKVCMDSAFVSPGGDWLYASKDGAITPGWAGPYCVTVVPGKK